MILDFFSKYPDVVYGVSVLSVAVLFLVIYTVKSRNLIDKISGSDERDFRKLQDMLSGKEGKDVR